MQGERNRNIRKSLKLDMNSKKISNHKSSFRHSLPLLHTRSSRLKNRRVSKMYRKSATNISRITGDSAIRSKANSISYSLRKCSELIKRSLRRPSFTAKDIYRKSADGNDSKLNLKNKPQVIRLKTTRIATKENDSNKSLICSLNNIRNTVVSSTNIKKSSPISLNTRSRQGDVKQPSTSSKESATKVGERIGKPTIVFCKPSPTSSHTDLKSKIKDSDSKDKLNVIQEPSVSENHTISKRGRPPLSKSLAETPSNSSLKSNAKPSLACSSKAGDNSGGILESNKIRWCLRKPKLTPRISYRMLFQSDKVEGSSKVQTRNKGQRTVVYNEDSDNNYLTEILENEDPVKQRRRHSSDPAKSTPKEPQNTSSNSQGQLEFVENKAASNSKQSASTSFLRPKKEALKILSNGIETRNHGQRTTLYAEDGDDYLEEYFDNLEDM